MTTPARPSATAVSGQRSSSSASHQASSSTPSKSNGSASGSSSSAVKTSSSLNGTAKAARPSGTPAKGSPVVVVTSVKRKPAGASVLGRPGAASPSVSSSSKSASKPTAGGATNALSEERRRRIAEDRERLERERRKKEEANLEALRALKRRKFEAERSASKAANGAKNGRARGSSRSDDSDDDDDARSESSRKRRRSAGSPADILAAAPTVGAYKILGRQGVQQFYDVPRSDLAEPLSFEEACERKKCNPQLIHSKAIVEQSGYSKYGTFFRDLENPDVELQYPNAGAKETFTLLCPKSTEEYDPINDLLRTVYAIAAAYLGNEERAKHFGTLDELIPHGTAGQQLTPKQLAEPAKGVTGNSSPMTRENSLPSRDSSDAMSPAKTALLTAAHQAQASGVVVAAAASARSTPDPASPASSGPSQPGPSTDASSHTSILRSFAKARNRRDGPLFVQTIERFNAKMQELQESGAFAKTLNGTMTKEGVPEVVWHVIQDQCYARTVGPTVEELSRYAAFSDNVYGELLPRFMSEIAQLTSMKQDSVFLDLGSGVGNLLIQMALQTGCEAYGCEFMPRPSEFAKSQLEEARTRWAMWSLRGGEMDAWQGDFCQDARVAKILERTDLILVNNYAFQPATNHALSLKFLDLKDGAQIVSLKPFVPPDFRLTERTLSSPLAILRVEERLYTTGCVSWADRSGKYYIHTVDRNLITAFMDKSKSK